MDMLDHSVSGESRREAGHWAQALKYQALPHMASMLPAAIGSLGRGSGGTAVAPMQRLFRLGPLDVRHIEAYRSLVCGGSGDLPLTYFYLLAQRAQLRVMIDRQYPYSVPGMIHVVNALKMHRLPRTDRPFTVRTSVDFYTDEQQREQVHFTVEFEQNGELTVTCTSEYLARRPPRRSGGSAAESAPAVPTDGGATMRWEFDSWSGWRYAKVSGDYNPIHLSARLARAFGFRHRILQGMYGLASTAATIEGEAARPLSMISVRFRKPLTLPGRVFAHWDRVDAPGRFAMRSLDEPETVLMQGDYEFA
jgi:acyl dehydratase